MGGTENGRLEVEFGDRLDVLPARRSGCAAGASAAAATEGVTAEERVEQVADTSTENVAATCTVGRPPTPASPKRSYRSRVSGSERTS